jgi:hypothetical protein
MTDRLHTRHRRPALMLGGVLMIFLLGGLGIWALIVWTPSEEVIVPMFLSATGAILLAILILFACAMPRHSWILSDTGIEIVQRLGVPIWPARRAHVTYGLIAGLARTMAGFDTVAELRTQDGRRFRLSAPRDANGLDDPEGLEAFLTVMRNRATAAGHSLPPIKDQAGIFERPAGLAILWAAMVLCLGLAGGALWGLVSGASGSTSPGRLGQAVGVLVLLPVGVGWLLIRSYRRRRKLGPVRR